MGFQHTCAVLSDGSARCWGNNAGGQLGNGTTTDSSTPVAVASLSSGVANITAAGSRSQSQYGPYLPGGRSCVRMVGGGAKCWGGDGFTTDQLTPFDVDGLAGNAMEISTGVMDFYQGRTFSSVHYTCVLTTAGAVQCFGARFSGSLGDGISNRYEPEAQPTPVNVVGLASGVTAIDTGGNFSCALLANGSVKCWGSVPGYQGIESFSPVPAMMGTLPQSITFGSAPSVPIGGSGTLLAYGGPSAVPLAFTSLTPSICGVTSAGIPPGTSGTTVNGLASGMCTIAADQAGSVYYDPAPQKTITFRIGPPVAQTITFGAAPSVVVGGVGSLNATASSGLAVSFVSNTPSICTVSGNTVTGVAVGSCTVTAQQGGDALYGPAPQVTQTFPVSSNNGTFGLVVSKAGGGGGTVTSNPAGINCGSACGGNFTAGSSVTLAAAANSTSVFTGWSGACTGSGGCTVPMNGSKSVTATFEPAAVVPRLVNISTRMKVLTGDDVMIGGFIIGGSAAKTVVVRARGPSLAAHGVADPLANPKLDLYSGQTVIGSNDDWTSASNAAALSSSGYAPASGSEAALMVVLPPGPYTAIVSGVGGTTGTAIVEVFELDHPESRLINIATRGRVQTGNDVMIGGFAIQGNGSKTVVVRARGPSLAATGITNPLQDPYIDLYSGQTVIASNDNWANSANASAISSSGFAPADGAESAILVTLAPGLYSVIVRGADGGSGVGIIEVFAVP
jgi:hypothetical protein